MKTFKQILEDINSMLEDELVDDFTDVDIKDTDIENHSEDENIVGRTDLSLTDELDAKLKISRALDNLKAALDVFKDSTFAEIDLINDSDISLVIENLTKEVDEISDLLRGRGIAKDIVSQPELDEQEPKEEPKENEDNIESSEESKSEEEENEDPDQEEESEEEVDFDDEAELDLFNAEEN